MIGGFRDEDKSYSLKDVENHLKNMVDEVEGYGGTYVAGTLIISVPDTENADHRCLVSITIDPIDDAPAEHKNIYYYASLIYVRAKSETASFRKVSVQNIEKYAGVKRLSEFLEGKEFNEA